MERIKELKESKEKEDIKESFEIREKNRPLTNLLKNKTGETDLENFPQEVDYYLESEEGKLTKLKKEKEIIGGELSSYSGKDLEEKLQRKNYLQSRINKIKRERDKGNGITRYLSYITNNERL